MIYFQWQIALCFSKSLLTLYSAKQHLFLDTFLVYEPRKIIQLVKEMFRE